MKILATIAIGLALFAGTAQAQSPAAPPNRTIGQVQRPQIVPSFIVLNAQGAQIANQKLTLQGISTNAIVFADRPVRAAGHVLLKDLLEEWSAAAQDSFAKEAPSATVSVQSKAKNGVLDAVVVLRAPKLDGANLTFDVQVLEGNLAGADGAASVFIDITNVPVAHRTGRRTAWYSGAQ